MDTITMIMTAAPVALLLAAAFSDDARIFIDRGRTPASGPKNARTPEPRPRGPSV